MIGRLHHVILDCPEPEPLAEFYSALLGLPITFRSSDFVVVSKDRETSGVGFQRVSVYVAPAWPDPAKPQQAHFDVMVDDLEVADAAVLARGATRFPQGDHVYADPVGHPFCLVRRPEWAAPIG